MGRCRILYDRQGMLAEYQDDVLIWLRGDAELGKTSGPQVVRDINPYKSMITGQMITSRSTHRDHLKRHGCVEIGNDTSHLSQKATPKVDLARKRTLASQFSDMSDRQISQLIGNEIRARRN